METGNYFGLMYRGYRWSDGDYKDSSLRVYSVDDDGQFYAYADVPSGYASFEGNEIFVVWLVGENGYYAPLYDYRELKKLRRGCTGWGNTYGCRKKAVLCVGIKE